MTNAVDLPLARRAVDRAGSVRTDPVQLDRLWRDPATRVLRVYEGESLVSGDPPALVLTSPEVAGGGERYFLGLDEHGTAYFASCAPISPGPGELLAGIRAVGGLLDDRDIGLLVHAIALANWHATHRHCARCGAPTDPVDGGHVRRCPVDGSEHFPRTDPAVIMLVSDSADRALLGRQPSWPQRRFSTLAGFVEPGESAEHAVIREVHEEAGVDVAEVRYFGSQPWPFPSSLMLGFLARATTTDIRLDDELVEARWFTRDELYEAVGDRAVLLPPPVSIARRLIESWFGGELPNPTG
jgi:NAD+ diphosphatase